MKQILKQSNTLWIDFEMRKDDNVPAMAGLLIGENFSQIVFDESLQVAVDEKQSKGHRIELKCFDEWAVDIYDLALNGAAVCGYSSHELKVLKSNWERNDFEQPDELIDYFDLNANRSFIYSFKTMWNQIEAKKKGRYNKVGLKDFLQHPEIGYAYPRNLRGFSPASTLNRIREQSEKKSEYSEWSKGSKRAWSNFLTYNEHDVRGMKHLVQWVLDNR